MVIFNKICAFFYSIYYFKIKCINKYVAIGLITLLTICSVVFFSFFSLTTRLMEIGENVSPAINITHLDGWKNDRVFKYNSVYMYKKNGLKIKVSIKKGSSTYALENIIRLIDNAPSNLLLECTDILVSPDEIQTESVAEEFVITEHEAFTYKSKMFFHDAYLCNDTFYHEAGHIYDTHNNYPSQSEEFKALYESEDFGKVVKLSLAACEDSYEAWAIATAVYLMNPQTLQRVNPDVYNYFAEVYE